MQAYAHEIGRVATGAAAAILLSIAAILAAVEAKAEPIACAQARTPAEHAICNSEDLLVLDEKLAAMVSQRLTKTATKPGKQAFSREQQDWLSRRNDCNADPICLELRYGERIAELSGPKPIASFTRFSQKQPKG
jgi:uncharacterized protein